MPGGGGQWHGLGVDGDDALCARHPRWQGRCSCVLIRRGLGHETDGVAQRGHHEQARVSGRLC